MAHGEARQVKPDKEDFLPDQARFQQCSEESTIIAVQTYGPREEAAKRLRRGDEVAVTGSGRRESVSLEAAGVKGTPGAEIAAGDWRMGAPVRFALVAVLCIVAFDALHEVFGLAGSRYSNLIDSYFYDLAATGAGILMLARGLADRDDRGWVLLALGTFSWVVGDILADLNIGKGNGVSVSDAFWLAWYPLAAGGLMMLVRVRFTDFDFARWVDGIALALVVATPGVALALQPAVDESHVSVLAHIVDVAYPAGDILLLGSTIGVIALTGWRPGRTWYLVSVGLSVWVVADALYSVQQTKGTYVPGVYDYLWPAGLLLLAYAAWQPRVMQSARELYGWKAVFLPVACQVFALATQVWGLVATLGESERIMTIAVLTVVIVQLYVSRPRPKAKVTTDPRPLVEPAVVPTASPDDGIPRQAQPAVEPRRPRS